MIRGVPKIEEFSGVYRFLSNFYPATVALDGKLYRTVEHAYQAAKTRDEALRAHIRAAESPARAKQLGRRVALRAGWNGLCLDVMRDLIRQKFAIPELCVRLLATGDAELIEGNDWGDDFWGMTPRGGSNWLGRLLMEVRSEIRAKVVKIATDF